jgi:cytochrome c556
LGALNKTILFADHTKIQKKEKYPAIIDFHHNKGKKEKEISFLVMNGYAIDAIKNEMKKCETLCSNCHRKFPYKKHKLY